jgi:hypothetical protein
MGMGLTAEQVSRRLGYTKTSTFCHALSVKAVARRAAQRFYRARGL